MKRIVVCCDGTWNRPDEKDRGKIRPTNVVTLARSVAKVDARGVAQIVYYDRGVGTGFLDRLWGGAFGYGLTANIKQAYRYLVRHFEAGDELFLFGFSRGAYTVRSLAGLIRNSGLLLRNQAGRVDEAYSLYRRRDSASHPTSDAAQLFRSRYAVETRIKLIGVWDTVGALGIPGAAFSLFSRNLRFHDVKLSSHVDSAFQALAIDERRSIFSPAIWERQEHSVDQVLEQVWFAGVHANVGGGYEDTGLSDLACLWMKSRAAGQGLAFDEARVEKSLHENPLGELRDSRTGIYRWFGSSYRAIGRAKNGEEYAHSSAVERMEQAVNPKYDSRALKGFLKRGGRTTS